MKGDNKDARLDLGRWRRYEGFGGSWNFPSVSVWLFLTLFSPIPFDELTLVLLAVVESAGISATGGAVSSALIVDVEVDRPKPDVSGAR